METFKEKKSSVNYFSIIENLYTEKHYSYTINARVRKDYSRLLLFFFSVISFYFRPAESSRKLFITYY